MTPTETLYKVYELLGKCLITPPLAEAKQLIEKELSLNLGSKWPDSLVQELLEGEKKLFALKGQGKRLDGVVEFSQHVNEVEQKIDDSPILTKARKKAIKKEMMKIKIRVAHDLLGIDLTKMKGRK